MNRFVNYPARKVLVAGFLVIFLLVLGFALVAWIQTNKLWTQTELMYNHPLRVRAAVDAFRTDVLVIHRAMKDVVLEAGHEQQATEIRQIMSVHENDAFRQLDVLQKWFLGEAEKVDSLRNSFVEWNVIRNETLNLLEQGRHDEALHRTLRSGVGGDKAERLLRHTEYISNFARGKALQFLQQAEAANQKQNLQVLIFLLGTLMTLLVAFYFIFQYIQTPLQRLMRALTDFRRGEADARVDYSADNEFGQLAESFNKLFEVLGDQQKTEEQSALLTAMMLQETDARTFSKKLLALLLEQSGAQLGAIYLPDKEARYFEPYVSIGFGTNLPKRFDVENPEGEFGTALANRKMQYIRSPKANSSFTYHTVSGEVAPSEIITLPLEFGGDVVAVISLGTVGEFSPWAVRYLKAVYQTVGARMNGVLAFRMIQQQAASLDEQNRELEMQKQELTLQTIELEKMNAELEQQKRQLDEASRLKSSFLSNMSHELRTPLNSVIALSGVLDRRLKGQIPDEEYQYLEIIGRNGRSLLALINDILDLSRIEAGREEVFVNSFSVKHLVDDLVSVLSQQAKEKGIELKNLVGADLPIIHSDQDKCMHILQNIIGNAVKFTNQGSVEISAFVIDEELSVVVRDTGIGISPGHLPHIFDEFRQADDSSSRKFGGTGLGLSIAKKYASLLKGTISVESQQGEGTMFMLKIPVKIESKADTTLSLHQKANLSEVNYQLAGEGNGYTVLLVDDSQPALIQMTDILCSQGYKVLHSHNGFEAIDQLSERVPDAIILDLMMPGMDGFEVLSTIRSQEQSRHIPVLILTARQVTKEELSFLKSNNIHQLIQKGDVNRQELLLAISRMIALQQCRPVSPATRRVIRKGTGPLTILVVEDNPDNMATMKAILGQQCQMLEAVNGRTGVDQALEHMPHLILMDLALPEMSGFEALVAIRKHDELSHIPVVAVTASVMKGDREKVLAFGFDRFVPKPVDETLLWHVINELLAPADANQL
ncbi:MAG: response regulator [Bacteroidales bacterium]|nr:response regulator [Bacteroidales bacterium]